jgi:hypothetical protein
VIRRTGEYTFVEAGILEEADVNADKRVGRQQRLVLLAGCLGGVLLTVAVMALAQAL